MIQEKNIYAALICKFTPGIGDIKGKKILQDPFLYKDLVTQVSPKIQQRVDQEYARIKQHNVKLVTILDEEYPPELRFIYNPPIVLYYYGILPKDFSIAVVGTRRPSQYGVTTTRMIVSQLCEYHIPIISGFAYGIDTVAHQSALEHKTLTIGVLGTGIDMMYPASNTWMRKNIIESGGCILSEFPMGTSAKPTNFPIRNRIISGLSRGILVVEASTRSGSLITAKTGLEQGKNIFTIPGTVFGASFKGSHNLIKMGAILVENGYEILQEYPEYQHLYQNKPQRHEPSVKHTKQQQTPPQPSSEEVEKIFEDPIELQEREKSLSMENMTRDELIIYESMEHPISVEELVSRLQMKVPYVLSVLTSLILKGLVQEEGGLYSRV